MMDNSNILKKVLTDCLRATPDDKILIISDENKYTAKLGEEYQKAAQELGLRAERVINNTMPEDRYASSTVIDALDKLPEQNVVILNVANKLKDLRRIGKSFRRFCQDRKHRFISTTGVGHISEEMFKTLNSAIDVDYATMQRKGTWLKNQMDYANMLRFTTEAGTDITVDITGMDAIPNTGDYKRPGGGGNIPAGEVYIAPKGTTNVNGTVVIDGSLRTHDDCIVLDEPVIMTIVDGKVVNLSGKHAHLLDESFKLAESKARYPERVRVAAEFGIGINPNAKIVGTTIVDEKVLGTAHVAIGSNYWFGGENKTIVHVDQVFKNPKIFLDDKEIIVSYNETSDTD